MAQDESKFELATLKSNSLLCGANVVSAARSVSMSTNIIPQGQQLDNPFRIAEKEMNISVESASD